MRVRGFLEKTGCSKSRVILAALQLIVATSTFGAEKPFVISAIVSAEHPVNRLVPTEALGAGVDGHEKGECAQMFTDKNIIEMLLRRARTADISTANRAGRRSLALEPARHLE